MMNFRNSKVQQIHQLGCFPSKKKKQAMFQWLFLVPLKGGRWHIIPQLAVYTTYILPSGGLYATYHLLGEPETTIDFWVRLKISPPVLNHHVVVQDVFSQQKIRPWTRIVPQKSPPKSRKPSPPGLAPVSMACFSNFEMWPSSSATKRSPKCIANLATLLAFLNMCTFLSLVMNEATNH